MPKGNRITNEANHNPGPGSYLHKDVIGKWPKVSISGKNKKEQLNDNPGPGQYNASDYYTTFK